MPNPRTDYLRGLIERFPNHGALTLAKAAYAEAPEFFRDLEGARSAVRSILGVNGEKKRSESKDKTLFRTPRPAGRIVMPESRAKPWEPFTIEARRVGILSDVHVPYHDKAAVNAALSELKRFNPDCVLLNGDIADFYKASRWEQDPRKRDFVTEVAEVRQFLALIRQEFRKARIVYKLGNHEERWYSYLYAKAPILVGLDVATFDALVDSEKYGIEVVEEGRKIMLGHLTVLHGHELPKGMTNPVNPARGVFLRTLSNTLIGHQHRTSEHTERSMDGHIIATWSTGCLCDMTPEYARVNRWNHGAATVEVNRDGSFHARTFRILEGRVY
jgi:predicted phosphodiesterase